MKKFIKILSLMLAILMISSTLVACGDQSDKQNKDKQNAASGEGGNGSALPAVDWEGQEYRIIGRDYTENNFKNFEIDRDEMPGDVVGIAVWNRNVILKQKYGLDVVGTLVDEPGQEAKVFLDAGDDLYDLVVARNTNFQTLATVGQLVNLNNLKYVDLDHECWNDYVNEQMTFGGKLYYTNNKFLLQDKHRTWMLWYNRTLANELNVGYLEQEVFDGTWTIDRLIEIAKTCVAETDGVDGLTGNDRWGLVYTDPYCLAQISYGCGFRLSNKDESGYPVLVGATDKMVGILDKIHELSTNTDICFVGGLRPTSDDTSSGGKVFKEGRAVISGFCLSGLDNLYMYDFEYGALPNPKWDVDQEQYICVPNVSNGSMFGIPATVTDRDKADFALQAISEESVDTTYKEYINTRCLLQDAYDEDMAKCLRIIFDTVVYDIALIDDFGGLGKFMRSELIQSSSNTFSRTYTKNERRAKTEIKKIAEAYAALPY